MSLLIFQDNASSLLASGILATDLSLTVTATTGSRFSAPSAGQFALLTLEDVSGNIEVVKVTARTGDSFTIVRAQEGTTALPFASGSAVEQRVTAGMLGLFLQKTGSDTLSGTTTVSGVLAMGGGGSIQGGEIAGTAVRSQPGDTSNQILVPIGSPATAAGSIILTKANLTANLPSGAGIFVTGMICLWYGTVGSIPSGFQACDGTGGSPDLRDQFVVGAGGSLPTTGGSSTTNTAAASTGVTTNGYTLGVNDIPAHTHDIPFYTFGATGGSNLMTYDLNLTNGPVQHASTGNNTTTGNAHSHGVTDPTHFHTYNLPPYKALYYIMKT